MGFMGLINKKNKFGMVMDKQERFINDTERSFPMINFPFGCVIKKNEKVKR